MNANYRISTRAFINDANYRIYLYISDKLHNLNYDPKNDKYTEIYDRLFDEIVKRAPINKVLQMIEDGYNRLFDNAYEDYITTNKIDVNNNFQPLPLDTDSSNSFEEAIKHNGDIHNDLNKQQIKTISEDNLAHEKLTEKSTKNPTLEFDETMTINEQSGEPTSPISNTQKYDSATCISLNSDFIHFD